MDKKKTGGYGLGLRTIKTALAVEICIVLSYLLGLPSPIYACVTVVIAMQSTPSKSWEYGKQRLFATAVGGVLSLLFLWIFSFIPYDNATQFLAPLVVLLGIVVCNSTGHREASAVCGVVILILMISVGENIYIYALRRLLETAGGVIVATLVNWGIKPRGGWQEKEITETEAQESACEKTEL